MSRQKFENQFEEKFEKGELKESVIGRIYRIEEQNILNFEVELNYAYELFVDFVQLLLLEYQSIIM